MQPRSGDRRIKRVHGRFTFHWLECVLLSLAFLACPVAPDVISIYQSKGSRACPAAIAAFCVCVCVYGDGHESCTEILCVFFWCASMQLKFDFHVHNVLAGVLYSVAMDFWCNFDFVAVIWYHRSHILSGWANSCLVNLFFIVQHNVNFFSGSFLRENFSQTIWRVFMLCCKWLHLQMSRIRTCFNCNLFGLFYRQKKNTAETGSVCNAFLRCDVVWSRLLHTQKTATATKECTNNKQEEAKKAKRDLWSLSSM